MTVEGQRYLEECRKVLKEEQMDAVSMGLDFGLPVSDIQKVVKSNQEAPGDESNHHRAYGRDWGNRLFM